MVYTIHSKDYVHDKEHSFYNHNYYRNIHTGEVILEDYEEDGCGTYYNLGTNPSFTRDDFKTATEMGSGEYGCGFCDEVFVTNTEWIWKNNISDKKVSQKIA